MVEDLITELMNTLVEGVIMDLNSRINEGKVTVDQEIQLLQLLLAMAAAVTRKEED